MKTLLNANSIRRAIAGLIGLCLCVGLVLGWAGTAQAAGGYQKNDRGQIQNYEPYDTVQPKVGGMNRYEDTDPRRDTSAAESRIRDLDRKSTSQQASPQPLESAGKSLKNLGQQVKDNVKDAVN